MRSYLILLGFIFLTALAFGQNNIRVLVKNSKDSAVLQGITVTTKGAPAGTITNESGLATLTNLTNGEHTIHFSAINFFNYDLQVHLPDTTLHEVYLQPIEKELEEVTIVSTTRTNQHIENSPLKVEVLGKEEMDEENTIKPANIASILSDVSGIQIQQSSATSGNANVRIQGLEGRYTQILRDGMPLFEGFAGGFGVLTIPPLDLRQIELVKGSASTLYGGGAIGGLINLISKRPTTQQEAVLTMNQTTLKESNINGYLAKRNQTFGYSVFAGYTHQGASDVNTDGLSDVPKLEATIIHPRLFFYPSSNTVIIAGYAGIFEKRNGGDVLVIKGKPDNLHQFFEKNETVRHTGEFILEQNFANKIKGTVKASVSFFDRDITTDTHFFSGNQLNYYTEASVLIPTEKTDWVTGINVIGDRFEKKQKSGTTPINNFSNNTYGAFAQLTLHLPHNSLLEAGLRTDHHNDYGTFVLPRVAFFHRFNEKWATRLGFGMGYKTPNVLAPQNVEYDIEQIQPIGSNIESELSYGFNAEFNFKKELNDEDDLFINHAFFLTSITSPIIATEQPSGSVVFSNMDKPVISKGFDTYIQMNIHEWEIYAGYTFTIAKRKYLAQNQFVPLTPKNRAAFTLVREFEPSWRVGLEGSYTGPQYRDNERKTPGYVFIAALAEHKFQKHISLVLNCENLLDYRQSKKEPLFFGRLTDPQFRPLWAPIDGRVLNLALRIKK
jgi:iron complex outermembrane receptor protein/outer membrane receptor for ferrienterochelin and colicins